MRAVAFDVHGGPEVLKLREVETPTPKAGEALVRISATGINQVDRVVRMGYPGLTLPLPHIPGGDVVGTVAALGPGVRGPAVGTRVVAYPLRSCGSCALCEQGEHHLCLQWKYVGMHLPGSYAEFTAVPAENLIPLPPGVSDEAATALPVAGLTALHALSSVAGLRPGQTLLLWGGTGALGTMALSIAKQLGARVIATGSSPARLELMRTLGADLVLNRREDDVPAAVRKAAPAGVDVVLDYVGPQTFQTSFELLRKGGQLLLCGILTGREAPLSLHQTYLKHVSIKGLYLGTMEEMRTLVGWLAEGRLTPHIGARFELADVRRAHERLEAGESVGKTVLRV